MALTRANVGLVLALALATLGAVRAADGAAGSAGLIVFVSTRDGPAALFAVRPDGTHLTRLRARAAGDPSPRVSPDGRSVVFDDENGTFWVLDLATGKERRVPARGLDGLGHGWASTRRPWSPDSKRFAVGADSGLVVFGAQGIRGRRITRADDADPAWSPDGKLIAFVAA